MPATNEEAAKRAAERDLLRRLVAGDERAIEALFHEHAPGLWRIAYRYLHSSNDAKEAVQDVFIAVWHRRTSLRVHGQFSAYLATAVRNRALTALRNELRRRTRETQWSEEHGHATTLPTTEPNDLAARKAAVAQVDAVLATLPPRQRLVFELRVRSEMTVAEVRDAIGARTDKTVERLYSRAVQALRKRLKPVNR